MSLLRELFRPFPKKLATVPAGRLLVFGALAHGDRAFSPDELAGLDGPRASIPDLALIEIGNQGETERGV